MKGTSLLLLHETYNDRKAFIMDCVLVSRKLIVAIQSVIVKQPELSDQAYDCIELERQYIINELAHLTSLERWRITKGLARDEPNVGSRSHTGKD